MPSPASTRGGRGGRGVRGGRGGHGRGGPGRDGGRGDHGGRGREQAFTAYVGNLDYDTTDEEITGIFTTIGLVVTSMHRVNDKNSGRFKGTAFVSFETEGDLLKAVSVFNGETFRGRSLKVNVANARRAPSPHSALDTQPNENKNNGHRPKAPTQPEDTLAKLMFDYLQEETTVTDTPKSRSSDSRFSLVQASALATLAEEGEEGDSDGSSDSSASTLASDTVRRLKAGGKEKKAALVATVKLASRAWKRSTKQVVRQLARAQRVAVAFLSDTTGSMGGHIDAVKKQCHNIEEQLRAAGCSDLQLAFVGYKDWCDGEDHFEVLDFTRNVSAFRKFVGDIVATGGGDTAEDVLGGLQRVVKRLRWPADCGTRVIFHFADAPQHGRRFYTSCDDNYPDGHPKDPTPEALFSAMKTNNMDYYFGAMNTSCDVMLKVFEECYRPIERLDVADATNMGAAVIESVSSSVSHSSRQAVASSSRARPMRNYTVDHSEPDFGSLSAVPCSVLSLEMPHSLQEIVACDRGTTKLRWAKAQVAPRPFASGSVRWAFHGRLLSDSTEEDVVFKEMQHLPLASAGMDPDDAERARHTVVLDTQTVATKLAQDFCRLLDKTASTAVANDRGSVAACLASALRVKFLKLQVVRLAMSDGAFPAEVQRHMPPGAKFRFLSVEKRFRDKERLVKLTNNSGFVRPHNGNPQLREMVEVATAFSHYTWAISEGKLLVCDLQGVRTRPPGAAAAAAAAGAGAAAATAKPDTLLLTDPAIHAPGMLRFGKTNLGEEGIRQFFSTHKCNDICRALKLMRPDGGK